MAESVPTIDGAGVRLRRAFGNLQGVNLDPFLLLDEMYSDDPKDTAAGFPYHPHRGIETMTIMIEGQMNHDDSLGNHGQLKPGDIQYMTGGSGIIHQEMPQPELNGYLRGLQLWINLPRIHKMSKPRYQEFKAAAIPTTRIDHGIDVRIYSGNFNGIDGVVHDIPTQPRILDISLEPEYKLQDDTPADHTMVLYGLQGEGRIGSNNQLLKQGHLAVLTAGDQLKIEALAQDEKFRFMMFSGKPIREPVAWHGPVVMNTREELIEAFQDLQQGTFIRHEYKINENS